MTGGTRARVPVGVTGALVRERTALLLLLTVLAGAFLVVFDREWLHGEVFSPADLVFEFYPWAYDAPRAAATNATRSDEAFYHQPLMATHFERLRAGELPDLDPTHLSGVRSFFQGLDAGRLVSPFSMPFYMLPPGDAVNVYGPLRLLVAGLCMWLLLRGLRLGAAAAALGGAAYALNGNFLTWLSAPMPTVAAWLPLGILAVHRVVQRPSVQWSAILALSVGLMALGSYPATLLACLLALGVQTLFEVGGHLRRTPGATGNAPARRWLDAGRPLPWLVGGVLVGLLLGATALGPTLANLTTSPASARVVSAEGAGWANLATWALPDFWGSPLHRNWWHPDPTANYPEHVAYFGITVVALAAAGAAAAVTRRLPIGWALIALTLLSVTRAYGVGPGRWLVVLPGQLQSNPFRWYAIAACALAALAGLGLHALASRDGDHVDLESGPPTSRDVRPWPAVVAALVALMLLGAAAALALQTHLPEIRARSLQPFEMQQVTRFALIATATAGLVVLLAVTRRRKVAEAATLTLVVLAAGDLAQANRDFNPTVPRERFYPETRGLDWLAEQAAGSRIAPVDAYAELVEGHVWGLYGIDTVTGFDFHGDPAYQAFLRAAQDTGARSSGAPEPPLAPGPVWDFVGLTSPSLDLRLLGLLGARYVVTSPVDTTPRAGGYAPAGPLSDGRTLTFTFTPRFDGLRRVDVLTATYQRANAGALVVRVVNEHGIALATRRVPAAEIPDNDWLRLEFPPAFPSAGRPFTVEVTGEGATAGQAPTVWTTAGPADLDASLTIDGVTSDRALWIRTFSTAPERVPGADLAYAGDLNVYRNPHARPRAWFVNRVSTAEPDAHLSRMLTPSFDPSDEAIVGASPSVPAGRPARVTSVELADDERRYTVEAGQGGLLVLSERADAGWSATVDGRPWGWTLANGILMAVEVPAGAREVILRYEHPWLRPSLGLTCLALAGIVFALLLTGRRAR